MSHVWLVFAGVTISHSERSCGKTRRVLLSPLFNQDQLFTHSYGLTLDDYELLQWLTSPYTLYSAIWWLKVYEIKFCRQYIMWDVNAPDGNRK